MRWARAKLSMLAIASLGCTRGDNVGQLFRVSFGGGGSMADGGPACVREAASPVATTAPRGAAVIVFVRTSSLQSAVATTIVDRDGRFVGRVLSSSHIAVTVPPGEHTFIAWAHDAAALRVSLAPGKRYYVDVGFDFGWSTLRTRLEPVKAGSEAWNKVSAWLAETRPLVRDDTEASRCLRVEEEELAKRIRGALEKTAGPGLRAEDGR